MQQQGDVGSGRALLWMLSGAALIGSNGLMVRFAETPPTISAFYRMLFAGLMLGAVITLQRGWRPLPRQVWWWCAAAAAAFAADLWLWHRSILLVGPGLATLLANGQVFFMALAGVVLFGERVGLRFASGIGLAFFGLYLMLGGDWDSLPAGYRWGVWAGLGTGLCYALYNLALRRTQREAHAAGVAAGHQRAPIAQVLAVIALMCALLLGIAGVIGYFVFDVVQLRVNAWWNPWPDATDRAFQIVQSLYAISSGGVIGQGIGQGSPTYVPVVHSDFAFAAIAEEWGLVGSIAVLCCFVILGHRGLRTALLCRRPFQTYLAAGVTILLCAQAFMIIGGVVKILPLTGVTLPLVSYGGSSLVISGLMIGLLLHLSTRRVSDL